jgi:phytanoyl-CoA hydroxylase
VDIQIAADAPPLSATAIAQFRRDGFVVLRAALGPRHIAACIQALTDLATGALPVRETSLMFEAGATDSAADREMRIRKYMDFTEDAPALKAAANSRLLHLALDQLLGQGRVLFQEMALVKPPRIGSEKPWHQDASYFRLTDPALIAGVWIALDPALAQNGCMELVPGSHLGGGVPHIHENDFNRCRIQPDHVRAAERVAVEMQPGDALLFHSLVHHYTAPNTSDLRRRAIQFHYYQNGAIWGDVEQHRRHFHFADGSYAGCTLPHGEGRTNYAYRNGLVREVAPADTSD